MSAAPAAIAEYVQVDANDCWTWQKSVDSGGYGRIRVAGRRLKAHRHIYELLVGPIPDGLVVDHLCRNRACVNPAHLEPVTIGENVRRGLEFHRAKRRAELDPAAVALRTNQPRRGVGGVLNSAKTACPQGHPYDEENTIIEASGGRRCRICRRIQAREAQRRRSGRALLAGEGR